MLHAEQGAEASPAIEQDNYLKAGGELHAALIEDAGMTEFFGLHATIIAIKRRLYHVKHPLSTERQVAVLESGICLAQDIVASPDARSAQNALKTYYAAQFENSGLSS